MEKLRSIAIVVVGIGLIIGGIVSITDDKVMCGSQEMTSASHVCEDLESGETLTVSEQRDDNKRTGWLLIGFGVLLVGGGIWQARSAFGKAKAAQAQAAGMPPGPQPPQQFAPQGAPMQAAPPGPPAQQFGPPPQQYGPPPGQPAPQPPPPAQWGAPPQYGPPPQGQYGPPPQQWGQPPR